MKRALCFGGVVCVSLMTGCGSASSSSSSASVTEYQGTWLAPDYGHALRISDQMLQRFDYTAEYCLLAEQFEDIDADELRQAFVIANDVLEQKLDYGAADVYVPGNLYYRSTELPPPCQHNLLPRAGDPDYHDNVLTDFIVYAHTIEQLSANLTLLSLDWSQLHGEAYARLKANPTEQQLYQELVGLLQHQQDGHGTLGAGDDEVHFPVKALLPQRLLQEFLDQRGLVQLPADLASEADRYIQHQWNLLDDISFSYATAPSGLSQGANRQLSWFMHDDIGYLQINAMDDFIAGQEDAETDAQLSQLDATLDQALAELQASRGLIIDVRHNTGGDDVYSLAVISRFVVQQTWLYQKSTLNSGSRRVSVGPRGAQSYLNPVIVLTSATTASAAEVFALAMSALPQVTLMGEASQGALSDSLDKVLPRGLPFSLSNEIYQSLDGHWYEGQGIPVDVPLPQFDPQERLMQRDLTLEAAIELLQQNTELAQ